MVQGKEWDKKKKKNQAWPNKNKNQSNKEIQKEINRKKGTESWSLAAIYDSEYSHKQNLIPNFTWVPSTYLSFNSNGKNWYQNE